MLTVLSSQKLPGADARIRGPSLTLDILVRLEAQTTRASVKYSHSGAGVF
jgi:hypothetical protein